MVLQQPSTSGGGPLAALHDSLVQNTRDKRVPVAGVISGKVLRVEVEGHPGMVEVKFRWLGGSLRSWARVAVPMAGKNRGFYFMPDVGDEVLLAFDHGDVHSPYVIGSLWNASSKPPDSARDGNNNLKTLKLRSGHELTFKDDKNGNDRSIEIKTSGNQRITLNDSPGKEMIEIADSTGNIVKITNKEISISAQAKLSIKAPTIEMQAQGSMSLKSTGPLTIQGAVVKIN